MARILVIDDDDAFRDTLVRMLGELGHTPAAAANGLDGVRLFRASGADLIITDIIMPYADSPPSGSSAPNFRISESLR